MRCIQMMVLTILQDSVEQKTYYSHIALNSGYLSSPVSIFFLVPLNITQLKKNQFRFFSRKGRVF